MINLVVGDLVCIDESGYSISITYEGNKCYMLEMVTLPENPKPGQTADVYYAPLDSIGLIIKYEPHNSIFFGLIDSFIVLFGEIAVYAKPFHLRKI